MKVRDIALARSGDKGNRATLSVIAHRLEDYPLLTGTLTEERVRSQYAGTVLQVGQGADGNGQADAVLFDFNHPLAGQPVTFEVQLIGVL